MYTLGLITWRNTLIEMGITSVNLPILPMLARMLHYKETYVLSDIFIIFSCKVVQVLRRVGVSIHEIPTSLGHLEYITYMHGVDVVDQLYGSYSCQMYSHKWWNHLFYFLIDTSVVNMWILHKEFLKRKGCEDESLSHFNFIVELCKALTKKWVNQKTTISLL